MTISNTKLKYLRNIIQNFIHSKVKNIHYKKYNCRIKKQT